jgi:hypothetical protein
LDTCGNPPLPGSGYADAVAVTASDGQVNALSIAATDVSWMIQGRPGYDDNEVESERLAGKLADKLSSTALAHSHRSGTIFPARRRFRDRRTSHQSPSTESVFQAVRR